MRLSPWCLLVMGLSGCVTGVSGSWTGAIDSPNQVGVRFVFEEKDGQLSGRTLFEDPETHQFELAGQLVGTTKDGDASWTTETDVQVSGKFQGNKFVGTITFPADGDEPSHTASLSLSR